MIEFKNIEIKFGDFIAVKDLNINVHKGEFFTLLGPSGCGKTTTLRSLVGFIKPSKGTIFLEGKDITDKPIEKRDISMVFQSYALFPTLTVYENIAFGPKVKKMKKNKIDEMVKDIAEKVDLNELQLQKKVSELSGGQQQRVAIARALVMQPNILVLDEPLSNLDAKLRIQLRNELKTLQKQFGITTIYVTHDQEEALTLSDRIAVFNQGVVEQIGTPEDIYNKSETEFVCNFIGDINNIDRLMYGYENLAHGIFKDYSKFFVRIEKVKIIPVSETKENSSLDLTKEVIFSGKIVEKEFYGLYTKYAILCEEDTIIKTIEKGATKETLDVGSEVKVAINIQDILKYK
ncbi:ABC transporter ATP-binding protein [Carnobacterium sp.]|uniref:ABC transporter ATP-binding protein n=1 Tax=Carnobacterium sp. TaxID=48221 RepID=UPI0028B071AC|nr:ABC transporter ATP-binding protein [Carnobacterium sp.]